MATKKDKPSKVEQAKESSNYLRGSIAEVLADPSIESFDHDDIQALKFHGIYQQDDRDNRQGRDKHYMFMIRTKTPGGRLTARQYLAMDELATKYTWNDSLRITTRQAFQFHGVIKSQLKQTMAEMNRALVSSLAACGDIERNVMCSPAPWSDPAHQQVQALADEVARKLAPATGAYFEIWLDGEKVDRQEFEPGALDTEDAAEPFYGMTYLPRKFKTGIALPQDNSVDVYTQDVGLVPVISDGRIASVNVLVGGGLGMTHRKADTFARKATPLGSVAPEHAADAVRVVASIFRDFGNRSDRRHARLKYLIDEWGMERFRDTFVQRADFALNEWVEIPPVKLNDFLGRHDQGGGRYFYGVWVENGRIIDREDRRTKAAFRKIVQQITPTVILTPNQSILFADLTDEQVSQLQAILDEHDVPRVDSLSAVRRYAMACPALPTCGLALAESERYLPDLVEQIEGEFARHGLEDNPLTIRMTGCPNGCARPYTADLAFVGRKPGVYDIYIGGRLAGDRLAELYADSVADDKLIDTLRPLIDDFAANHQADESFGDYFARRYATDPDRAKLTGSKDTEARVTVEGALLG